jgi:hypothetical protein
LGGFRKEALIMKNSLPTEVKQVINSALSDVDTEPKHRLSHQRRLEIYNIIKASSSSNNQRVTQWLAAITAQRVLPLFQQEFPDDTLPEELINTAIGVLQGKIDNTAAKNIQDQGYQASGASWGYDEEEITWNAELAGSAAYHALMESRGQEPLEHLDMIFEIGVVSMLSGNWVNEYPEPKGADQFTDENLCEFPNCDTAGIAAVAFSCHPGGPICDALKLKEFWTWWLTEAIPRAWEIAQE